MHIHKRSEHGPYHQTPPNLKKEKIFSFLNLAESRGKIADRAAGFTLLEAIVALVILASAGMALFAWINTQLIALQRVNEVRQSQAAQHNALALLELINPMAEPEGEEDFGPYRIRWRAGLLEPVKDGVSSKGEKGLYEVGLYRIEMDVLLPDNSPLVTLEARQVGYKQVRFLER